MSEAISKSASINISVDDGTIPVTIGGTTLNVCPLDEISEIDSAYESSVSEKSIPEGEEGLRLLQVIQSHIQSKFDTKVNMLSAEAYHQALVERADQVRDFFTKKLALRDTSDSIPSPSLSDADLPT